ncbi:hypothetical protein DSUL_20119 [Desulfovibrionales bacterium]
MAGLKQRIPKAIKSSATYLFQKVSRTINPTAWHRSKTPKVCLTSLLKQPLLHKARLK